MKPADLWSSLGFEANPYQSTPLMPRREDYELFIGRDSEGVEFQTLVEGTNGCVVVLSGDVGVGKTSFFNIQQYLLYTGGGPFGPKLLPALDITPLDSEDTATGLARRVAHNAVTGIEKFCRLESFKVPKQIKDIRKWLSHKGSNKGFDIGLSVLGSGGNVAFSFDAPAVNEATLENWKEILQVISSEVREALGFDGFFAALDNVENLDNKHLSSLLMNFRDTLFVVEGLWWVVIGQSGLYSLIDSTDKRVSQRIQGTGLELKPLSAGELHEIVEARVRRFRQHGGTVSPISPQLHTQLYEASRGEIRFVLKTSDALVRSVVTEVRKATMEILGQMEEVPDDEEIRHKFSDMLAQKLVDGQIPDSLASNSLRDLTFRSIHELRLKKREIGVLHAIGEGEARASDHKRFRIKTMQDFSSNYLTKMFRSGLLHRRQAGPAVYYSLRGHAALAAQFKLFERLMAGAR